MTKRVENAMAIITVIIAVFGILAALVVTEIAIDRRTATVIEKNLIMTEDGNIWEVDTHNRMIGGKVKVYFDNRLTFNDKTDDKIISVD